LRHPTGSFFASNPGSFLASVEAWPADVAGIRPDDRISNIDEAAIASRPLAQWRALLRDRAPGTKVRMHVERAGDRTLVLAELVP
jgi:C-terminal processing protease CtpA/Prc